MPRFAIIRPDGIPTDPVSLISFDEQLLACFKQTDIVKGIVDANLAEEACALLKLPPPFSDATRKRLYAMIESLYT